MSLTADPSTQDPAAWGPPQATGDRPPSGREQRLQQVLGRARRRDGVNITERWLLTAGGALAVAGVVLVIIGWVGTSRTILVAGQIPYLVSGGLLGLALVFLGGFLYFGYWLALLVRDGRGRSDQERADLARVVAGLDELNRSLAGLSRLVEQGALAPSNGRKTAASTRRFSSDD